jgi:arylsulfatase
VILRELAGRIGATLKVDWPILVNRRLDPFERTGMYNGKDNSSIAYYNWFAFQFWRFVFVQQEVAKVAQTAIEFPPMQPGASFNLEAIKRRSRKRERRTASKTVTWNEATRNPGSPDSASRHPCHGNM